MIYDFNKEISEALNQIKRIKEKNDKELETVKKLRVVGELIKQLAGVAFATDNDVLFYQALLLDRLFTHFLNENQIKRELTDNELCKIIYRSLLQASRIISGVIDAVKDKYPDKVVPFSLEREKSVKSNREVGCETNKKAKRNACNPCEP